MRPIVVVMSLPKPSMIVAGSLDVRSRRRLDCLTEGVRFRFRQVLVVDEHPFDLIEEAVRDAEVEEAIVCTRETRSARRIG